VMLPNHIDTCVEAFHRAPDLGVLRTVSGVVNRQKRPAQLTKTPRSGRCCKQGLKLVGVAEGDVTAAWHGAVGTSAPTNLCVRGSVHQFVDGFAEELPALK
jgi:hypothetical protein